MTFSVRIFQVEYINNPGDQNQALFGIFVNDGSVVTGNSGATDPPPDTACRVIYDNSLLIGLGSVFLFSPKLLRAYLTQPFRPSLTPDHLTWHVWQKLQHLNPTSPNHDPNNLGVPPPEDLVARRPGKQKAEHIPPKMPLPKKINLHSDEL
ncbi:uncharacterized protein MELLADRAFT_113802 [Melampsora larici-populina 98AG31]|uniref:Uncharacterized protein n=1 Tax=Melampsora larici-populina (strain 98AG31 / pathotype 3-4-7) TaxID=747676 RepID=F4SB40_MELLP|nr:uncharacterized protein MELLADRAFT_113802 [Melampsora larici-populina 98AG31]EGF98141.1 hypothetical protein MELLADRAFT_113802 [Melampsora larici-populina 98AG31]